MAKTKLAHDTLMAVCTGLEARYGKRKQPPPADFIQNLIHQILEVGASEKDATSALERIAAEYIDWNDMRVAGVRELMDIPVFHDDQHGTAIITAAGLVNALFVTGRDIKTTKVVVNGAGSAPRRDDAADADSLDMTRI